MMIRFMLILLFIGFVPVNAGDGQPLDFSQLHYDPKLVQLIATNIPPEIENELATSGLVPEALNFQIVAIYFPQNSADTSRTSALVYYADGFRHQSLQAFRFVSNSWKLVAATDNIIGESWLRIGAIDVDCDGNNEIILGSATGAAGFQSLEVVKFEGDSLRVITPQGIGNYLVGRYNDFVDISDGCGKAIEVYLDGPVKYEPDRKRIYRFDRVSKSYKFHSEEKLESQKTDE